MGAAMATNYGSFGNESLAKAEAADETAPSTLRPGAIVAGYQKPNRADPREAELRLQAKTKAKAPTIAELAKATADARRSAMTPEEARAQKETIAVALAQPHRGGSDDPMLAFPLGRFCYRTWPGRDGSAMRNKAHAAGSSYATEVRAVRVARGFHVAGSEGSGGGVPEIDLDDMSPQEREAVLINARTQIAMAEDALAKADATLVGVMLRLPRAMVKLCFDLQEPSPYDEGILKAGLLRLAVHYGHEKPLDAIREV